MYFLFVIMAINLLLNTTFEGRHGTHTIEIRDTLGGAGAGFASVTNVEWSYGDQRRTFDGGHGGRIGSEVTLELIGDEDRTIRDTLDAITDERRYQVHITGPRYTTGPHSTYHWYGVVQSHEYADSLSPSVFPRGAFTIRAVDGIGLLQNRAPVWGTEGDEASGIQSIAETLWQLREAQGTIHGFNNVRVTTTLRALNEGSGPSVDRLRIKSRQEGGEESIEEKIDIILRTFHLHLFQPSTQGTTPEWWVFPNTRQNAADVQVVRIDSDLGPSASSTAPTAAPGFTVDIGADTWSAEGEIGRVLSAGELVFEGPSLGQLVANPTFDGAWAGIVPPDWRLSPQGPAEGSRTVEGHLQIPGLTVNEPTMYYQPIGRLPELEHAALRLELEQSPEGSGSLGYDPGHMATVGFALVKGDGGEEFITKIDPINTSISWVPGSPFDSSPPITEEPAKILIDPIPPSASRTTPVLPLESGGDLSVWVYGGTENPGSGNIDAVVTSVRVFLIDAFSGQELDKFQVRSNQDVTLADQVNLPLVSRWEWFDMPAAVPGQWVLVNGWQSLITSLTYVSFTSAVAAERLWTHTRLRWVQAEIEGLYTPEFLATFEGSGDAPFTLDFDARLVACDLDLKRGTTVGTWLEVIETEP